MTNYIEQLMKAAGVDKIMISGCCSYYIDKDVKYWETKCREHLSKWDNDCENCPNNKIVYSYPDFTPEKQLELIKLLSVGNGINYYFSLHKDKLFDNWEFYSYVKNGGIKVERTDFEEGLAKLVLRMTLEGHIDKSEVKKILED